MRHLILSPTLALAALAAPLPAAAQKDMILSAQRELMKLVVPRMPIYDNAIYVGVDANRQIRFDTSCSLSFSTKIPAYRYGGKAIPAIFDTEQVYLFETSVSINPKRAERVLLGAVTRSNFPAYSINTASPADALKAKALLEQIGANCRTLGTRVKHSAAGSIMACDLVALPDFRIHDSGPVVFDYRMRPRGGATTADFILLVTQPPDARSANFGAHMASPLFRMREGSVPAGAVRYLFQVDGKDMPYALAANVGSGFVNIRPATWRDNLPAFRAIARGRQLTVRAYNDRPSQVAEWHFDLSRAREVEGLVRSTVRRC